MNIRGQDKTGLAKAIAILSTIFVISLGLCGANAVAAFVLNDPLQDSSTLAVTGYFELLGIFVGGVGVLLISLIAFVRSLIQRFSSSTPPEGDA